MTLKEQYKFLVASWKLYRWLKREDTMDEIRKMVMRYLRVFVSAGVASVIAGAGNEPIIIPLIPVISVIGKLVRDKLYAAHPGWAKWLPL